MSNEEIKQRETEHIYNCTEEWIKLREATKKAYRNFIEDYVIVSC